MDLQGRRALSPSWTPTAVSPGRPSWPRSLSPLRCSGPTWSIPPPQRPPELPFSLFSRGGHEPAALPDRASSTSPTNVGHPFRGKLTTCSGEADRSFWQMLSNGCQIAFSSELAHRLSIAQSNVSRLERRDDMLVSTLRQVVQALGGELKVKAVFPKGSVEIKQFLEEPMRPAVGILTRG